MCEGLLTRSLGGCCHDRRTEEKSKSVGTGAIQGGETGTASDERGVGRAYSYRVSLVSTCQSIYPQGELILSGCSQGVVVSHSISRTSSSLFKDKL